MRGGRECDRFFAYLQEHPRDVWDYEERVREELHLNFRAHWTDADILETEVRRFKFTDVGVIEYRVALRRGAQDPRLLVDMLRRCRVRARLPLAVRASERRRAPARAARRSARGRRMSARRRA